MPRSAPSQARRARQTAMEGGPTPSTARFTALHRFSHARSAALLGPRLAGLKASRDRHVKTALRSQQTKR
jgi:hypothetical protein